MLIIDAGTEYSLCYGAQNTLDFSLTEEKRGFYRGDIWCMLRYEAEKIVFLSFPM